MDTGNYVAKLNEYAQRTRSALRYEDLGSVGQDHNQTFTQRAVLNGKAYPHGVGRNKKEARYNAAKNALNCLLENKLQDSVESTNGAEASTTSLSETSISNINYICWLNEYGQKNRVSVKPLESTRPGPNNTVPSCSFVVDGKNYPAVSGKTKRAAKEEAARLVYDMIHGSKTEAADENCTPAQTHEELNQTVFDEFCGKMEDLTVNSRDNSFMETNFIGIVNHYCQKTQRSHTFIEDRRCGPPHNLQFFYKLKIDNKEYPVGEGKSVKEARQNAAQLAWSALQEQSDWDSKVSVRSTTSEDGASSTSAASTSLYCSESSSQNVPMSTTDSIIFADVPTASKAQVKQRSMSQPPLLGFSEPQSMETGISGSTWPPESSNPTKDQVVVERNTSTQSRFTSEFDSIERLGKGGFGRVYKAREKLLDKFYAIKVVCGKKRALREVLALSELHHRNIVRYYHCWMEDSEYKPDSAEDSSSTSESTSNSLSQYLYIKMELCDTTLKEWISERNSLTLQDPKRREESLTIAQQVVNGVEYIHSRKLIHRDLKPANIMFGQDRGVKIGDFGLVTAEADDDDENPIERTNRTGTQSYMAPEQKSKRNYDRKVDIFALGLIYFELLWKLSTVYEKCAIWTDVRSQKFPNQFSMTFSPENKIMKSMLCANPEQRPEASTVKAGLQEWAKILNTQKNMHQQNVTV
ncbi:interferon-induced, double-stranded RNA-activated protein kinase-like [Toxotes jaculatrix]|uniref:interferon-induced, double-stranded RNA-activated protein kinase-like n=1 Tax=Toxotes jaculatrix TaxID=941984 RepID=UPI001B3AA739|nr:interferon-induced, double-stranded RNA-activated protein kinase-like [Toxotes jaculatrix]